MICSIYDSSKAFQLSACKKHSTPYPMINLHGQQLIGSQTSAESSETFQGFNPATSETLPTHFHEATSGEMGR